MKNGRTNGEEKPIGTEKTRVSRHNGRAGKHGVYNPKHNDRSFKVENAENINPDRTALNQYWDWKNGLRDTAGTSEYQTFTELEREFYAQQFGNFIEGQRARNKKTGHSRRDRSTDDLLADPRFCPEETIYQIGKEGACPKPEVLMEVVNDFMTWYEKCFGSHIKVLDWALHLDETSPHIHARQVFFITNRYGECEPKQEKALEELQIPLPHPNQKPGRTNNRKMKFDEICREELIETCRRYGLEVESEAVYGGRTYMEKQDYIIAAQQEKLKALEQSLAEKDEQLMEQGTQLRNCLDRMRGAEKQLEEANTELSEKHAELQDIDHLTQRLTDIVYNSTVDAVTEQAVKAVQAETVKQLHEEADKAVRHNGSFFRSHENAFLTKWLAGAGKLIKGAASGLTELIRERLRKPEVQQAISREAAEKAKPSVRAALLDYQQNRIQLQHTHTHARGGESR